MMFWLLLASVTADKMMDECHTGSWPLWCVSQRLVTGGGNQCWRGEHSHHMPAWLIQCGWIHEIDTRKGKYEICWKYLVLAQNINVYRVSWYLSIFIGTSEMRHLCVLKFNILNIMKWWHIVTLNINITTAASPTPLTGQLDSGASIEMTLSTYPFIADMFFVSRCHL